MPRAQDLLREKEQAGRSRVVSATPLMTVVDAAKLMNEHRIGALPVLDDEGRLVGMFTERDVLTRIVGREVNPREARVGDVMTSPVIVCQPETPLDDIRSLMRERRIRHVPIVDGRRVLGLVSIGDLNMAQAKIMRETITYLEQYMHQA